MSSKPTELSVVRSPAHKYTSCSIPALQLAPLLSPSVSPLPVFILGDRERVLSHSKLSFPLSLFPPSRRGVVLFYTVANTAALAGMCAALKPSSPRSAPLPKPSTERLGSASFITCSLLVQEPRGASRVTRHWKQNTDGVNKTRGERPSERERTRTVHDSAYTPTI